jgi:hypothetical protein
MLSARARVLLRPRWGGLGRATTSAPGPLGLAIRRLSLDLHTDKVGRAIGA